MLHFLISNKKGNQRFSHGLGPIVLGRSPRTGGATHVIDDDYCSAQQLRVEELPDGRVRLTNLSRKVVVKMSEGKPLGPGVDCSLTPPLSMAAGETLIEIRGDVETSEPDQSFSTISRPVVRAAPPAVARSGVAEQTIVAPASGAWSSASLTGLEDVPGIERLTRWFETVVSVQRSAASSDAFFQQTARAVVDLIGLDCGLVLSRQPIGWKPEACYPAEALATVSFSKSILELVCRERRTYFRNTDDADTTRSLANVSTLVASPIFAQDGVEVSGVVYGIRLFQPSRVSVEIRPLEAQLVQVLAAAVGAGLARRESELEAARRSVQFQQFFSQELARELDRDPSLLDGREREVTVLVSDIRGFSGIAERLGPRETCLLMNDALGRLTAQIQEHGGVVVDYIGDGIMAMWNAPLDQPDHGARACRAALAMQAELPGLNGRWQERIGAPLGLGIGINTGPALVGNTGSPQKFKYGALGHTVNLASRVEGATKQLGVPILITGSTHDRLAEAFATRRLCRVRVVGLAEAVDLHELNAATVDPSWESRRATYEAGLALFESGRWAEACQALYPLLAHDGEGRFDLPTLSLVGRGIECLKAKPVAFNPVLDLSVK